MPWANPFKGESSKGEQPFDPAEMGKCLSRSKCPCEAGKSSAAVVPSASPPSGSAHFLRLVGQELSPFTARIRIALQFKGIQPDFIEAPLADRTSNQQQQQQPWLASVSPDGSIPCLEHGADTVSGSSDAILDYIDNTFKDPPLFPSWRLNKRIRSWVTYIRDVFTPLIIEAWKDSNPFVPQGLQEKLDEAFEKLETGIAEAGPYFLGKHFTMVDVYLIPFLELLKPLKYAHGIEINPNHSHLVGYASKVASFPSYAPVAPDAARLQVAASKSLEDRQSAPVVGYTVLQHRSILRHMEKLVEVADGRDAQKKQKKKKQQPVVSTVVQVGLNTQMKKFGKDYDRLLVVMQEHAQMEERVIFPALEKAERGVTKVATQEHARDFPKMNGVREDIKSVMALEQGTAVHSEALNALASKLQTLKAYTMEHFQQEERELLPLLDAAGLRMKQQESLMVDSLSVMESSHSHLLPFLLSGLLPHEIHQYMIMLHRSFKDGERNLLARIVEILQADDEFQNVWQVVQDRVPLLVTRRRCSLGG